MERKRESLKFLTRKVDDRREGPTLQYFPNGKLFKETPYVKDLIEGEEKTYYADGKLAAVSLYQGGVLHGVSKSWGQNGTLTYEAEYQMGKRDGKFNKYYDSGKPRVIQVFKDDQLISKESYDMDGNKLS